MQEIQYWHDLTRLHCFTVSDGLLVSEKYDNVICMRVMSDGSVMILGDSNGQRKLTRYTIEIGGLVVCKPTPNVGLQILTGIAEYQDKDKNGVAMSYWCVIFFSFLINERFPFSLKT